MATLKGHTKSVSSAAFSPDGNRVVTASEDASARLWLTENGTQLAVMRGHLEWAKLAALDIGGARVASADKTAWLWQCDDGAPLMRL